MRAAPILTSPAARVTLMMSCLFVGNGVALPFIPQWLAEERGLSGFEVGIVLSLAQLTRVIVGPLIASWADGFADRRTPLRLLSAGALLAYTAFFNAHGFVALAVTAFAAAMLASAMTPLIEGALLRWGREPNALPYGVGRAIGSMAFILGNLAGGALVARFGMIAVVIWMITTVAMTAASASFALSHDPAPAGGEGAGFRGRLRQAGSLLRNARFAWALAAAGLIQAAHAFYYNFSTLSWTRQGFDPAMIGGLWAWGVIVEVAYLASLPFIERRVSPETLLLIGGAVAALRWAAMAFAPPLWMLWPLQALHALSFAATHVAALRIVDREAPPHLAALGQTMYAALAAGTLIGLCTLLSGWLFDRFATGGYVAMAAFAAAGFACALAMVNAPGRPQGGPSS